MKRWSYATIVCVTAALIAGCSASPTERRWTQTGRIYDIQFGDSINPKEIDVRPGDEVRFINARSSPIKIEFIDRLSKEGIACENGFVGSRFTSEGRDLNMTTIKPNKYASLCFTMPGRYRYTARMTAPVAGGERNETGFVFVDR